MGRSILREGKKAVIDHAVEGALADHDLIPVMDADMVDRLFLSDKGSHDLLDSGDLILRNRDAGTAFGEKFLIIILGDPRPVELFFKGAVHPVRASVADIGRFQEFFTGLLLKSVAEGIAHAAVPAESVLFSGMADAAEAEPWDLTILPVDTGVIADPECPALFSTGMFPDLAGDGNGIFADGRCDIHKRRTFGKHLRDQVPVV